MICLEEIICVNDAHPHTRLISRPILFWSGGVEWTWLQGVTKGRDLPLVVGFNGLGGMVFGHGPFHPFLEENAHKHTDENTQ